MFIGILIILTLIYRLNFDFLKRKKVAPWLKIYQKLLDTLAKKDLIKPMDMTPTDFSIKVSQQYPTLSNELLEFTLLYQLLRYKKLSSLKRIW